MSTKLIIRDLRLEMSLGVYDHEQNKPQPVLVNVVADVARPADGYQEKFENAVCYRTLADAIVAVGHEGHINLAETLAERIADKALATPGITGVTVRVEKTTAYPGAAGVGVEIRRERQ